VHVTTNESFAGEPVEADVTGMQSALDSSLIAWLAHLKAAAESKGRLRSDRAASLAADERVSRTVRMIRGVRSTFASGP
jgi:hypothetical protein